MANYRLELLGKGAASDPNDGLTILTLSGDEEMSKVPCYSLEVLSRNADIRPREVLMQAYSVKCDFDDEEGNWHTRYFTGHAVKFSPVSEDEGSFGRYVKYRIELRPWLWFLSLRRNCWIFQGKSVQEIIDELLQRYPSAPAVEWRIAPPRKKREYCVQYRESDLDFFSRLLEEEGIHYWFEHSRDKAVLVLGNGTHAVQALPADDTLIYAAQLGSEQRYNELHRWGYDSQLCPDSIRLWDYDFITCEKREQTLKAEIPEHLLEDRNNQFDCFDYPAGFVEDQGDPESNPVYLDEQAEIRLAELRGRQEIFVGTSEWPDIAVGYTAKVDNHPNPELNQKVVIFSTHWSLADSGHDSQWLPEDQLPQTLCHFKAFSFQYWQRPPAVTRKPVIPGSQTAIVVGKENDEIYTDKHGRIKVRFHWDCNGSDDIKDENRSCWVRVAQLWAGNGWGTQFIPRVGQEVVVSFLEGDPDRPLVTGSVYNGNNKPTYEQPKKLTQSGIRTKSSPGGGAKDFNELMFEDKKGKEEIYFKAQRRMELDIGQNFYQSVRSDSHVRIRGNSRTTVDKNQDVHVYGNRYYTIEGDAYWTCMQRASIHSYWSTMIAADEELILFGTDSAYITSKSQIVLGCSRNSYIRITPHGIEINAPLVKINSGGTAPSPITSSQFNDWILAGDASGFKHDRTSLEQHTDEVSLPEQATEKRTMEPLDSSFFTPPPMELPPRPVLPPDQGIQSIDTTMRWQCATLQGIIDQGDAALEAIDDSIRSLENRLDKLLTEATDMGEETIQQAADLVGEAQVAMNEAKTQIASVQTDVCQALESNAKQFQSLAQNTMNGVCNATTQVAKVSNHAAVQSVLSRVGIANQVNQVLARGAALQNRLSTLQSSADQAIDSALDTSQDTVNAVGNTLDEALGDGADALATGADKLKSDAGNALNKASTTTRDALEAAIAAARAAKEKAKAALAKAKANACHSIPDISSALNAAKREVQNIGNAAKALLDKDAGALMDAVKDTAKQTEQAVDQAKDAVNDIHNKVKQAEQTVQNRTEQLAQQAENAVSQAKQQIDKAADQAKQAAADAEQALNQLI